MIVYGALTPHPPLIIPEIGRGQLVHVKDTVQGMKRLSQEVARQSPDTLVFFTPHGNIFSDALSVLNLPNLEGDLSGFGRGDLNCSHPNDQELLIRIAQKAGEAKIPLVLVDNEPNVYQLNPRLDHGIIVPLKYLEEAGLKGLPIIAISVGMLALEELYRFGMALQEAANEVGRKVAVIASGDMSHRLTSDGPYSFHPDGPVFDETVKNLLSEGEVLKLMAIPVELRENAGECGFRSIIMLMGALNGIKFSPTIFSYEGPLGVGYLTAGFWPQNEKERDLYPILMEKRHQERAARKAGESHLVRWARQCLEGFIREGERVSLPGELADELKGKAAAFVSLKKDGHLRGCIGTLQPVRANLALEIRENAIAAGTQDYRFPSVTEDELDSLDCSVDVLGEPEPIGDISQLDPKRYGVIVRSGPKSGVLLPDLEGVDTAEQQVAIACQKAGIKKGEKITMERFEVKRYY